MEFSDVVNFLEKINASNELKTGHHFLLDGNFIYCFYIKSITHYDPYTYFVGFSNPNASPVPTMTYTFNYEMELVRKIKLNRNKNSKLTNVLKSIKELISFCKNKNIENAENYDKIFEDFVNNLSNQDLLECM